ncbi:MAG: elongation factor Ts [Ignavibacteriae bacterium]|nr:elongation factor Ts [Ignavibacteriota bacterium]
MAITSEMIKKLRDKTGAGMMDCKRALEESGGDMDAAVEYLRKKGAAVGQKRADRVAKEGVIVTRVGVDGKSGVMVEVNCETDFVGRSEDFVGFANTLAGVIEKYGPATVGDLMSMEIPGGKKVSELMDDLLAKIGEKIDVRRFTLFQSDGGSISSYTHMGNKIGVLVELAGTGSDESSKTLGRDLAMQVAAMNPLCISRDQVDKAMVERELDIYRTQAKNESKPAQVIEKIASGRLEKFYQEICLLEQTFIKDSGKTVKDVIQEAGTKSGTTISVRRFQRFHLGEETK